MKVKRKESEKLKTDNSESKIMASCVHREQVDETMKTVTNFFGLETQNHLLMF